MYEESLLNWILYSKKIIKNNDFKNEAAYEKFKKNIEFLINKFELVIFEKKIFSWKKYENGKWILNLEE